jgi:hypothetical protein
MRAADLSRARGETRDSLVSYPGTPTSQQRSSVGVRGYSYRLSLITKLQSTYYNVQALKLELHHSSDSRSPGSFCAVEVGRVEPASKRRRQHLAAGAGPMPSLLTFL